MRKVIVTISLVIAIIMMITSDQQPIYGSPTTEDDGWTEGDYEGSSEEQEEQAQEDWEGAGRPGEIDDENDDENDNDNNDELIECEDGTLVETEELCEQSGALVQCSDGSYAATLDECPPESIVTEIDCPDGSIGTIQEGCPPEAETLPPCDGSFQDCITPYGDICSAGSGAHECEIEEPVETLLGVQCSDGTSAKTLAECKSTIPPNSAFAPGFQATSGPDNDCLYSPELAKCAPDTNGNCPDGFGINEDGQCFVIHDKCPDGYHGHEDDESGKCISNDISCERGYEMAVMTNGCDNCEQKQKPISCRDVPFYMTCDSQKKRNENKESSSDKIKVIQKTTVSQASSTATATTSASANEADISNCKLDGSADGIQQKFNAVRYQACGLYTYADKAYYDGFVAGCMQVGNTKLICETVANSNIATPALPAQTQTTSPPTQAIQPAAVN